MVNSLEERIHSLAIGPCLECQEESSSLKTLKGPVHPRIKNTSSLLPVLLFIHLECFGESYRVLSKSLVLKGPKKYIGNFKES